MTPSERAYQDILETLTGWAKAKEHYEETLRRFISIGATAPGQGIPLPQRVLDEAGLQELEEAENLTEDARKKHSEAIRRYVQISKGR